MKWTTPKTAKNMPIHLPSNQSVGEGGTKEEKTWKIDWSWAENGTYHETGWQVQGWSLRTEGSWEMNQTDKGMRKFVPQLRCSMPKLMTAPIRRDKETVTVLLQSILQDIDIESY